VDKRRPRMTDKEFDQRRRFGDRVERDLLRDEARDLLSGRPELPGMDPWHSQQRRNRIIRDAEDECLGDKRRS
jgi:hypothetical protein